VLFTVATQRRGKSSTVAARSVALAKRERDAQLRGLTDQAHGANTDLGHALIHNLTTVDPTDINVAKFFVLCRRRHRTNYADRLTMRISRCRTRGNGDEAGRGAAKARSGRAGGGEEDGFRRASMDRFHVGAIADAGGSVAPKVLA
jgi:hypothetical protein